MGSERLVVDLERRPEGGVVLHVSGKLEHATAPLLDGVLHALWMENEAVTLDLAGVKHIDADGLGLLLAAEAEPVNGRASVEIVGVRESLTGRPREEEQPPASV